MKKLYLLIFCCLSISSFGQTQGKFDGPAWQAPYKLSLDGWAIERFLIPIDFAPQIPYKGVEDIRFSPDWGKEKSSEYWSYAFLWYLDGSPSINSDTIKRNLNLYYDGLVSRNIEKQNIPAAAVFKTQTKLKQIGTHAGDLKTFLGTVTMLDYMEKQPMVLNCIVHLKKCKGFANTILFHQLSPKPYTDPIWKKLNQLWSDFNCKN